MNISKNFMFDHKKELSVKILNLIIKLTDFNYLEKLVKNKI